MNLSELSKLDIKDLQKLDYNQLTKELTKRPDFIIMIVAVLLSIILSIHFFSKNKNLAKTLRFEVNQLQDKDSVIDEYNNVKTQLTQFQNDIPEHLSEEGLINIITDRAFKRNLQIKSLIPGQEKEETFHSQITINVVIESDNFINLWLFIHDIESSPIPLRIDQWDASMQGLDSRRSRRRRDADENDKKTITVQIILSMVNFKNV